MISTRKRIRRSPNRQRLRTEARELSSTLHSAPKLPRLQLSAVPLIQEEAMLTSTSTTSAMTRWLLQTSTRMTTILQRSRRSTRNPLSVPISSSHVRRARLKSSRDLNSNVQESSSSKFLSLTALLSANSLHV